MRQRRHPKFDDISGRRFGMLEAISLAGRIRRVSVWNVRCDCGTEKTMTRTNLFRARSCGCQIAVAVSKSNTTHGLTRPGKIHPLYATWDGMKRRCNGSAAEASKWYKDKGIYVCDRWINGEGSLTGFECFLSDMGERPSNLHSIDRIDTNGPYSPENCRWATQLQQQRNRTSNRIIFYRGIKMTLTEAVGLSGINPATVWGRLKLGWSMDRALSAPVKRRKSNAATSAQRTI